MPKKRKKRLERTVLREKCIDLAKKIAKARDGYVCQKGGKPYCLKQIQASHVYAVGECSAKLACDPENIKALCSTHHHRWWHQNVVEAGEWFAETFPERWKSLQAKHRKYNQEMGTIPIQWWRDKHAELKAQFEELS